MCRPAGWSPTRHATPFGENRGNSMSIFRVTPLPSLTRATEAPGGLSLGFSPLGSPGSHPVNATSMRLFG